MYRQSAFRDSKRFTDYFNFDTNLLIKENYATDKYPYIHTNQWYTNKQTPQTNKYIRMTARMGGRRGGNKFLHS